ncbi:MAG: hypothetical protein Q9227_000093 [Pyrenula ochraceoflavens]
MRPAALLLSALTLYFSATVALPAASPNQLANREDTSDEAEALSSAEPASPKIDATAAPTNGTTASVNEDADDEFVYNWRE